MSVQAMAWAIEDAPDVPPSLFAVLMGLANHADRYGRNCFPSVETLAVYTRKSGRQVQRDLRRLVALGLIREGDQAAARHLPARYRPVVYDLAMPPKSGVTPASPLTGSGVTPEAARGDTHDASGVTPMSPKPSFNRPEPRARESADVVGDLPECFL